MVRQNPRWSAGKHLDGVQQCCATIVSSNEDDIATSQQETTGLSVANASSNRAGYGGP